MPSLGVRSPWTRQKLVQIYHSALVRVTAFVKGLALLHFQGLLKQMQDSLTTRRTKAIQEKKFDLFVSVD